MIIDLNKYQILRPEKLRWVFPNNDEEIITNIKSKSLRSFLRRSDELVNSAGIELSYHELTEEDYLNWLPYYRAKMQENNYDLFANETWYQDRIKENKKIFGIYAKLNSQIIGSVILTKLNTELATINFKASDKLDLFPGGRSSIGAVLDFFFLRNMKKEGFKTISAGVARNASGVINTYSYLDYKLRFGYYPVLFEDSEIFSSVPVNLEGNVIFYGITKDSDSQKLQMYGLKPKSSSFIFEQARFATSEIPFIELKY